MFVKPKQGVRVPDPVKGDALPESGRNVPDNQYWQRRIKDGDVFKADEPAKKKGA